MNTTETKPKLLYHYTRFEFALDDILNHHIKVATLDAVNDPYEWVFCLKKADGSSYPAAQVKDWWHNHYQNKVGFISLSEQCDNLVMWSHYADKHRGVVFGFECDPNVSKVWPVKYCSQRVEFPAMPTDNNELFKNLITRKGLEWRCEAEHRAYVGIPEMCEVQVRGAEMLYFMPIDGAFQLKEIVLGCEAIGRVREMQKVLHDGNWKDVAIKLAIPSPVDFRLEITGI